MLPISPKHNNCPSREIGISGTSSHKSPETLEWIALVKREEILLCRVIFHVFSLFLSFSSPHFVSYMNSEATFATLKQNNLCAISSIRTYLKAILRLSLNQHFDKFSRLYFSDVSLIMVPISQGFLETSLNSSQQFTTT